MGYDEHHFQDRVGSPSGVRRLAAVLSTLTVEEIMCFASEISEDLGTVIHNDEKASGERVQILVAGIAKFAADPSLEGTD